MNLNVEADKLVDKYLSQLIPKKNAHSLTSNIYSLVPQTTSEIKFINLFKFILTHSLRPHLSIVFLINIVGKILI